MIGETIVHYRIESEAGAGGMRSPQRITPGSCTVT
jgi:hypothetical protein